MQLNKETAGLQGEDQGSPEGNAFEATVMTQTKYQSRAQNEQINIRAPLMKNQRFAGTFTHSTHPFFDGRHRCVESPLPCMLQCEQISRSSWTRMKNPSALRLAEKVQGKGGDQTDPRIPKAFGKLMKTSLKPPPAALWSGKFPDGLLCAIQQVRNCHVVVARFDGKHW